MYTPVIYMCYRYLCRPLKGYTRTLSEETTKSALFIHRLRYKGYTYIPSFHLYYYVHSFQFLPSHFVLNLLFAGLSPYSRPQNFPNNTYTLLNLRTHSQSSLLLTIFLIFAVGDFSCFPHFAYTVVFSLSIFYTWFSPFYYYTQVLCLPKDEQSPLCILILCFLGE